MKKKKKTKLRIVNKQRFSFAILTLLLILCFSCIMLTKSFYKKAGEIKTNEIVSYIDNEIIEEENTKNEIEEEKTIEQLVEEVEQGLAGNGEARVEYLGDKYDEVMKIINDKYATKSVQTTNRASEEVTTITATGSKAEYQQYAHDEVINRGWSEYDFTCLVNLWNRESGWNPLAHNSSSGAHGIPQALPASKMAVFGDDYYTNGYTQIDWGLSYIEGRYGDPTNAWSHFLSHNWY